MSDVIFPIFFIFGIQYLGNFLRTFFKGKFEPFPRLAILNIGGKKKESEQQQQEPFVPPPTAGEQFNQWLIPYMQEITKSFQPFLTGGLPGLTSQLGDVIGKRLGEVSQSGFVGIGKELSDTMFQRAQERTAPLFSAARQRTGERAAGRGVLRAPVTSKELQRIDIAEAEGRRQSAIDQAIQEYTATQALRSEATVNAGNFLGIAKGFSPQFTSGGNMSAIFPPAQAQKQDPFAFSLGALFQGGGFGKGSADDGKMTAGDTAKMAIQIKLLFKCLPEFFRVDYPDEKQKLIVDVRCGDVILDGEGRLTRVMMKHEYYEPISNERFLRFTFHDGTMISLCDNHKMLGKKAADYQIGDFINNKEIVGKSFLTYGGISYDLLTESGTYLSCGVSVDSMIPELSSKIKEAV